MQGKAINSAIVCSGQYARSMGCGEVVASWSFLGEGGGRVGDRGGVGVTEFKDKCCLFLREIACVYYHATVRLYTVLSSVDE